VFLCQYISALSKAGMWFSVPVSYSVFNSAVRNYVAIPNMLIVSIYLKMKMSAFKDFQNIYFHGVCILGTFLTLYPSPVNAAFVFHA